MTRKKKEPADVISDLLEFAEEIGLSNDDTILDAEIRDTADDAAKLMAQSVCAGTLMEKLEFLYSHGYQPKRIKELLKDEKAAR